MNQGLVTNGAPFKIKYRKFKDKRNRPQQSDEYSQLVKQACHAFEMSNTVEAFRCIEKAIHIEPRRILTYITRGEYMQERDASQSMLDFNVAHRWCEEVTDVTVQDFPHNMITTKEGIELCRQQISLVCEAMILDTENMHNEAIDLLIKAAKLYELDRDLFFDLTTTPATETTNPAATPPPPTTTTTTDGEASQLDDELFNNLIEQIDSNEDNYIMSYIYSFMSYAETKRHDYKKAAICLMKALAYGPLHFSLSMLCYMTYYLEIGSGLIECDQQYQFFNDARAIDDRRCIQGASYIVSSLLANSKIDEALELVQSFVSKYQSSAVMRQNLGICYLKKGEYEKAEESLLRAIQLSPSIDIEIFFNLLHARTDCKIDPTSYEEYDREVQGVLQLALNIGTNDRDIYLLTGQLNILKYMRKLLFDAHHSQEYEETQQKWEEAYRDYKIHCFDNYFSFEQRLFHPECKYSTQMKNCLKHTRTKQLLSDCDIMCVASNE